MTKREQFNRIMNFREPGGIFLWGMGIRKATVDRWLGEGLPRGVDPLEFVGVDTRLGYGFDSMPLPRFETVILEETDRYKIWIDELGAKRLDFKHDREPGFVTRTWLKFPVETKEDLEAMKERFRPESPQRYRNLSPEEIEKFRNSEKPVESGFRGMFWNARDWMGFENLCLAFIQRPDFVHEIMESYGNFLLSCIEEAYGAAPVDFLVIMEDMAFKGHPMISPAMFREFISPWYRKISKALRGRGVKKLFVDCDGDCSVLIDCWIEAGMDGIYPVEIAAGLDPVALRRKYPDRMLMIGGVDKRAVASGPEAIKKELRPKLEILALAGGFAPGLDHAAPPDISLDNYRFYVDEVRRIEKEVFE